MGSKQRNGWLFWPVNLGVILGAAWLAAGQSAAPCPVGYVCQLAGKEVSSQAEIKVCQDKGEGKTECRLEKIRVGDKGYKGELLVKTGREAIAWSYGDKVQFKGLIEEPENFSDFDYRGYLMKEGVWAVLDKGEVRMVVRGVQAEQDLRASQRFLRRLDKARKTLKIRLKKLFQGEKQALVLALLLGDKSGFSEEQEENFRRAGMAHIVAISGMHMAIIGELFLFVWGALGVARRWAFIGTAGALVMFVAMIGAPASAVRAVLMGGLGMLGKLMGRKVYPNRLLVTTAAAMLVFNPLLFWHDIGFALSFTAVWGLVNLATGLEKKLGFLPERGGIRQTAAASIAAQAATLPLCVYHFGYFSWVAILANLLVFWVVFPLIFLGILAAGVSFLSQGLAKGLAGLVNLLADYLLGVADWLGSWSGAGLELGEKNLTATGVSLGLMIILFYFLKK